MNDNVTYTITFGDQAENHVGMQKIGKKAEEGLSYDDLVKIQEWFAKKGCQAEIYNLGNKLKEEAPDLYTLKEGAAYILVAWYGLNYILDEKGRTSDDFFKEQEKLEKDAKALMRGRVVNKKARHNLCFNEESQEPDYEHGKGRVVAFKETPLLDYVRQKLPEIVGKKGNDLVAEGNYYYDTKKCGIGYHGDSERRVVIGLRLGSTLPLRYLWFYQSKPVTGYFELELGHGDIYFMSDKATGYDWKRKVIPTLRHAAGCESYITYKGKK